MPFIFLQLFFGAFFGFYFMGGVIRQILIEEKLFFNFLLLLFYKFCCFLFIVSAFVYFDGSGWFVCFSYEI